MPERHLSPTGSSLESPGTVYVVDDDPEMRESLEFLIGSLGIATRAFASASAFLVNYHPNEPGCLVSDVRMPDLSGLDLVERLATRGSRLPVIFMTAHADVPMAIRALKLGATEFVEKPFNAQVMLDAIQRALAQDRSNRASQASWEVIDRRLAELTDKERELLALVLEGTPNKAMASQLDITERAVEMRRASIMRKLQARSLAELIRTVTQHQLQEGARRRTS